MICRSCQADNGDLAVFCQGCGARLAGLRTQGSDATGGIIPYKNPHALTAYYLGLFSLLPFIGFFLGVASVILGKIGLNRRKKNPQIHGKAHAWVGIGCGSFSIILWGGLIALLMVGALSQS